MIQSKKYRPKKLEILIQEKKNLIKYKKSDDLADSWLCITYTLYKCQQVAGYNWAISGF